MRTKTYRIVKESKRLHRHTYVVERLRRFLFWSWWDPETMECIFGHGSSYRLTFQTKEQAQEYIADQFPPRRKVVQVFECSPDTDRIDADFFIGVEDAETGSDDLIIRD